MVICLALADKKAPGMFVAPFIFEWGVNRKNALMALTLASRLQLEMSQRSWCLLLVTGKFHSVPSSDQNPSLPECFHREHRRSGERIKFSPFVFKQKRCAVCAAGRSAFCESVPKETYCRPEEAARQQSTYDLRARGFGSPVFALGVTYAQYILL